MKTETESPVTKISTGRRGALTTLAQEAVNASYRYWARHAVVCGSTAVVDIETADGYLLVFTRGEYRAEILEAIEPHFGSVPLDMRGSLTEASARIDDLLAEVERLKTELTEALTVPHD